MTGKRVPIDQLNAALAATRMVVSYGEWQPGGEPTLYLVPAQPSLPGLAPASAPAARPQSRLAERLASTLAWCTAHPGYARYETLAGGLQVALMLSVDGATWLRLARKNVYPSDQEWATVLAHWPYDPPVDIEPDRYEASDGLLCLRSSWPTPENNDERE